MTRWRSGWRRSAVTGVLAAVVVSTMGWTAALAGATGIGDQQVVGQDTNAPATADHGITVVGMGTATAKPDTAYLSLGVQTRSASAKDAMTSNNVAMNMVIAKVKEQGVEDRDIQTSGLSLYPVQEAPRPGEPGKPNQISGYVASNNVSVTVRDITNVGAVIDAAVAAGANNANGVRFGIADPAVQQLEALRLAVTAARARADVIAAASGVKITGVLAASEDATTAPPPRLLGAQAAAASDASTPVQAGELTITSRVVVTYAFQ